MPRQQTRRRWEKPHEDTDRDNTGKTGADGSAIYKTLQKWDSEKFQ